jgi:hypothetical protein
MRCIARTLRLFPGVVVPVALTFMWSSATLGQVSQKSAPELVEFLTYRSFDRLGKAVAFQCGLYKEDRAAAISLARLGQPALPSIEAALDSVGQYRPPDLAVGSGWFLAAYASIKGRDAFPRLRRMAADPGLRALASEIDDAISLSLGLTSYVSSSRGLSRITDCSRGGSLGTP